MSVEKVAGRGPELMEHATHLTMRPFHCGAERRDFRMPTGRSVATRYSATGIESQFPIVLESENPPTPFPLPLTVLLWR